MKRWYASTRFVICTFMVTSSIVGCAGIEVRSPHLNIDADGYAADDSGKAFEKPADQDNTTEEERIVNEIMSQISERVSKRCTPVGSGRAHVMLFVHGGMVSTRQALKDSLELDNEKVFADRGIDPVFINWNSSLISALADDLLWVRAGNRAPEGVVVAPVVVAMRLVSGLFETPPNLYYQIVDETRFYQEWHDEDPSIGEMLGDGAVGVIHAPFTIVSVPLFTGFGRGSWNMMKRRVDVMFAAEKAPRRFFRTADKKPGAMRTFLEALSTWRAKWENECENFELDYFGHSMGALVGVRLLRDFPNIEFDRIIFAAAASTAKDFVTTVPQYLEQNENSRFFSYGLSVIDEGNELTLKSAAFPRGSLLVWVDNFFDPILSPEDYRMGDFWNETVFKVPRDPDNDPVCERMHIIKISGKRSDRDGWPRKHGEFNDPNILGRLLDMTPRGAVAQFECGGACSEYRVCHGAY